MDFGVSKLRIACVWIMLGIQAWRLFHYSSVCVCAVQLLFHYTHENLSFSWCKIHAMNFPPLNAVHSKSCPIRLEVFEHEQSTRLASTAATVWLWILAPVEATRIQQSHLSDTKHANGPSCTTVMDGCRHLHPKKYLTFLNQPDPFRILRKSMHQAQREASHVRSMPVCALSCLLADRAIWVTTIGVISGPARRQCSTGP